MYNRRYSLGCILGWWCCSPPIAPRTHPPKKGINYLLELESTPRIRFFNYYYVPQTKGLNCQKDMIFLKESNVTVVSNVHNVPTKSRLNWPELDTELYKIPPPLALSRRAQFQGTWAHWWGRRLWGQEQWRWRGEAEMSSESCPRGTQEGSWQSPLSSLRGLMMAAHKMEMITMRQVRWG